MNVKFWISLFHSIFLFDVKIIRIRTRCPILGLDTSSFIFFFIILNFFPLLSWHIDLVHTQFTYFSLSIDFTNRNTIFLIEFSFSSKNFRFMGKLHSSHERFSLRIHIFVVFFRSCPKLLIFLSNLILFGR